MAPKKKPKPIVKRREDLLRARNPSTAQEASQEDPPASAQEPAAPVQQSPTQMEGTPSSSAELPPEVDAPQMPADFDDPARATVVIADRLRVLARFEQNITRPSEERQADNFVEVGPSEKPSVNPSEPTQNESQEDEFVDVWPQAQTADGPRPKRPRHWPDREDFIAWAGRRSDARIAKLLAEAAPKTMKATFNPQNVKRWRENVVPNRDARKVISKILNRDERDRPRRPLDAQLHAVARQDVGSDLARALKAARENPEAQRVLKLFVEGLHKALIG